MLEQGGVAADKLCVIHSGIDPTRYPLCDRADAVVPKVIGFVGALTSQKGCAVLLDALALLAKEALPAWKALLVGDGPLRAGLERQAASLGLMDGGAERVRFLGFRESREVMPGMDVLAVPSVDGEGSSGVIKEAWVTGLPVVVSDLPSNLELVQPDDSGLCVPVGDAATLADALSRLLSDAPLRRRLRTGGAKRVQSFTDTAMAERYVALYRDMVAGKGN